MKTPILALVIVAVVLVGCGNMRQSRLNPRNWFGTSQEERPALGQVTDMIDNRALVAQITELAIESTSSGALLRAEAVMPTAGWWDAELVPDNNGRPVQGVMTFRFVAAAPREPAPDTGVRSRTLVVAYPLSSALLQVTSEVVVTGSSNSRRIRR